MPTDLSPDGTLTGALTALLRDGRDEGTFGFIVEARSGFPLSRVLEALADQDSVYVSLIGLPEDSPTIQSFLSHGWTGETLGVGATHAVQVRNQAPAEALKVAIVWREEDRLHSLARRGYRYLGADNLVEQIALMGKAVAPNQPQRNLWQVLADPDRPVSVTLDGILEYFQLVHSTESNPQDGPRNALPELGLLRDKKLLAPYSSPKQIHQRLRINSEMVFRLQTGDPKDRARALKTVEYARDEEAEELRSAYKAFLRLARGESEAIRSLDLDTALRLFKKPHETEENDDDGEDNDVENGDGTDNDGEPGKKYDNIEVAALHLLLEREEEQLQALAAKARSTLDEDEIQDRTLELESLRVDFKPDTRAVVLARDTIRADRLGGTIEAQVPVDTLLREIGRFVSDVRPIDAIDLEEIRGLAQKAEKILPDFEGAQLLDAYLEARTVLLSHVDLLVTAPFTAIADKDVRQAAKRAVAAYERLINHFEQQYSELRHLASDGARKLYRHILSLDMILVTGDDESAALVTPVHPLILWKYIEIADLSDRLGPAIPQADKDLLSQELRDLPEPLSAIFLPSLHDDPELGYVGRRIGAFPLYRTKAIELADVGSQAIARAGRKLLALYPAARRDFRMLLVDPVSTREASRAAKTLVEKHDTVHVSVTVVRTSEAVNIGATKDDQALDELHAEGRLTYEEVNGEGIEAVLRELETRPVHLLVVSGQEEKGVEAIHQEASRLHPLSIPHRLHADQLTNRVSLKPRSLQPEEDSLPHPFAIYQSLVSELSGYSRMERTMAQNRRVSLEDLKPLLPHCLFLCVAGIPEDVQDLQLLRLSQGSGALGDSTFTVYGDRIIEGIDQILRSMNYEPREEGIKRLLAQLEEIAADEIFATISGRETGGFSQAALKGLLGLTVALGWYRSTADQGNFLVVSVDTFLARHWLARRPDGKRVDLIGFRRDSDGDVHVDVIEVKSYEATHDDPASSYPAAQLLAVAEVLRQIFHRRGDILTDRRREILRRQVYSEGLLVKVGASQEWVDALNDALDGERRVHMHLTLIELAFSENFSIKKKTFCLREPNTGIDGLPVERLRLGEKEIQRQLAGYSLHPVHVESTQHVEAPLPDTDAPTEPLAPWSTEQESQTSSDRTLQVREPDAPTIEADRSSETTSEGTVEPEGISLGFEPSDEELEEIALMAKQLYRAMRDIGIQVAEAVDPQLADIGPTIVRFKVKLRPEERTANVRKRARDIMRELAANKEPIIDVLPNTSFVSVDIPRPQRRIAYFRPELATRNPDAGHLALPFGVAPEGGTAVYDLADLPHMLVAGATGSGKTMFLYSLIVALIEGYTPQDVQLVLVDPKQTDFVYFEGVSLLGERGVITDPEVAINVLHNLLTEELENRTELLKEAKARDVGAYNERNTVKIPRLVVIIDEFADLADVMEGGEREEFDFLVRRLAQRARNVGIHLILATQRPTTDIINGTIKANLPCRVSFRLSSHVDSQTILDSPGAEKLLGKGDMLVSWNGEVRRLQGFLVDEAYLMEL